MRFWSFIAICLLTSLSSFAQRAKEDTIIQKGYLVFGDKDLIVFLPGNKACRKFTYEQIEKLQGKQVRGDYSDQMLEAKERSRKQQVIIHTYDSKMVKHDRLITLGVIAVEIKYYAYDAEQPHDNGFVFNYKGKDYTISYLDDWGVNILEIKYLK